MSPDSATAAHVVADSSRERPSAAACVTIALILTYVCFFGWLAIMRHETFWSSAMDMGYTDQVVWNTLHGRFMRFSTLENATIDLPLEDFRRTDTLLAYHVELLLVPLSLLYLVWSDPVMLLMVQVLVIALGAWPTYLLARDHLGSCWAGLVFAGAYLLAPATQGATLSDFHATSLICALFMFVMYAAYHRRWSVYMCLISVCLLAKEDIALLVFMLGGWLFLVRRERRVGIITMLAAMVWFLSCTLLILPAHNGLTGSPFMHRLAIFGPTLRESLSSFVADPSLLVDWLLQRDIMAYLGGLLASGGFLSLFAPLQLAVASPAVAINVFSTWNWTYSGGEHYSATILPFVIVSAIYGMERLVRWTSTWRHIRVDWVRHVLCLLLVAISGYQYIQQGIWPFAEQFRVPRMTDHHRVGHSVIDLIPDDASVSAQSNLYPHISQREQAYFYPAVNDAEYILLDVSGVSYPLTVDGLYYAARALLRSGDYGVAEANDGYLLLQRGAPSDPNAELPDAFFTFARGNLGAIPHAVSVRYGDALELVGWDYAYLPVVQSHSPPIVVTTWWRPLRDLKYDYQLALFFTREDGAITYAYDKATATTHWYPPYQWKPGEVIRMETPVLTAGGSEDVLIGVAHPGKDAWDAAWRLPVRQNGTNEAETADGGTLYRAFRLP